MYRSVGVSACRGKFRIIAYGQVHSFFLRYPGTPLHRYLSLKPGAGSLSDTPLHRYPDTFRKELAAKLP